MMNYKELRDQEMVEDRSKYNTHWALSNRAWKEHIKVEQLLHELYGDNIVLNRGFKYRNRHEPLEVRCHKCQHQWSPRFATLITNKAGCPNCRKKSKTIRP